MKKFTGFTLIELMVVVAILAIVVALALPSYQRYVIRTKRDLAQGDLQGLANAMERFYTLNGTYVGTNAGGGIAPLPTVFPSQSPIDGGTPYYNLAITPAPTASTYTLRAIPIAGTGQANDGFLQLTNTGLRSWDINNDGAIGAGENKWTK